jgi:hypothetical protein
VHSPDSKNNHQVQVVSQESSNQSFKDHAIHNDSILEYKGQKCKNILYQKLARREKDNPISLNNINAKMSKFRALRYNERTNVTNFCCSFQKKENSMK